MNGMGLRVFGMAAFAALLASFVKLPVAMGELVYDQPIETRVDGRTSTRNIINVSEKAQATVQMGQAGAPVQAPQPVYVQTQIQPAQVTSTTIETGQPEIENLSRSELLRRARLREELKNEDILQIRVEELRLRDEQARTKQLLGMGDGESLENISGAPLSETPGTKLAAVSVQDQLAYNQAAQQQTYVAAPQAMSTSMPAPNQKPALNVMPRGGLSSMVDSGGFYEIDSKYSIGVGLGVEFARLLGFEVGYTYSEYGVAMTSANPFVQSIQRYYGAFDPNFDTQSLKQNVFDAGLKVYFLDNYSAFRPFVGGGGGYSKSYLNYDQKIIDELDRAGFKNLSNDYELNSWLGYLSTGFDIKLSSSFSVGAAFKYYKVLSSEESSDINNAALYGGQNGFNPYYANGFNAQNLDKQFIGGSLADSSFYSILGGLTFSF